MKKISLQGKEYEAYHLIMRRENAEAIMRGEKTVEFRAFTNKYCSMFFDKEAVERNNKRIDEGRGEELEPDCRTDIEIVHFYNYNNTFSLDVAIDEIGYGKYDEESAKNMVEWFGCHELDDQWQQFKDLPDHKKPMFFYLHISEVLQSKGL